MFIHTHIYICMYAFHMVHISINAYIHMHVCLRQSYRSCTTNQLTAWAPKMPQLICHRCVCATDPHTCGPHLIAVTCHTYICRYSLVMWSVLYGRPQLQHNGWPTIMHSRHLQTGEKNAPTPALGQHRFLMNT